VPRLHIVGVAVLWLNVERRLWLCAQARRTMGSPAFFAPELCRDEEALVTPAVDIWAAGLTLFMFVFGQMPFDALSIVCRVSVSNARFP
jgi:serine/threonine protein kinase